MSKQIYGRWCIQLGLSLFMFGCLLSVQHPELVLNNTCLVHIITLKGTICTILVNQLTLYLSMSLIDDGLDMHSKIYDSMRAIQCVCLYENIINTLSGGCFVDKMDVCFYLQNKT